MQRDQFVILLHSSKTMRADGNPHQRLRQPALQQEANELADYLKTLSLNQLEKAMHISHSLALTTKATIDAWHSSPTGQTAAIDSFIGDIYSGLQPQVMRPEDRDYADSTLRILSGLYGILRPLDGIRPYRLEMGYKLPGARYKNLYHYWGGKVAAQLPQQGTVVNTSSDEYMKAVLPYIDPNRVVTPKFLTVSPKTGEPAFAAVHAKIARGAFAKWLITSRITDPGKFSAFDDLGYQYDASLSAPLQPTFVCQQFGGLGLSIRLRS